MPLPGGTLPEEPDEEPDEPLDPLDPPDDDPPLDELPDDPLLDDPPDDDDPLPSSPLLAPLELPPLVLPLAGLEFESELAPLLPQPRAKARNGTRSTALVFMQGRVATRNSQFADGP